MINVTSATCTGCRACEFNCPVNCIDMIQDDEGFLVAHADAEACIECGKCDRVCPQNKDLYCDEGQDAYAMTIHDKEALQRSASGGAFYALASVVLANNGVVYGAAYDANWEVHIKRVVTLSELSALQGSKYVQCDTGVSFRLVKEDLMAGRKVLFSGTPCQVAGLLSYIGCRPVNLITVDLVCHGVPSPLMFSKYVDWLESSGLELEKYVFRSKRFGWGKVVEYSLSGKTRYISSADPYNSAFMAGKASRECCYTCKYSQEKRCGDLTICDCWGIQREWPNLYRKEGVSGVIANSSVGCHLIEEASRLLEINPCSIEGLARHNQSLCAPLTRPAARDEVYSGIRFLSGRQYVEERLMPLVSPIEKIKSLIPFSIKQSIRRIRHGF